ncbi:MAG: rhamnogalacturonan acetylesterase [Terracidiphilus sp.]|nr:rhamnogalacturonan acetylesterase [Terracidiphilus sp.]MDR3775836.1 rhamnogalacturonan acetylesterase [Terracidiphilus sp.]
MKFLSLAVLSSLFTACGLSLAQTPAPQVAQTAAKIRIELVGDSTQTESAGYGLGFCANLTADVSCINKAKGGASTKTYLLEGYWEKALAAKPDYMLIQFGHNDEESKEHQARETNLQTEYPVNLKRYVQEARAHGVTPVLVTPLTRRYYGTDGKIHSDLLTHAAAMKKVAAEEHVPVIDLQTDSIAYLDTLTEAQGQALGITKKDAQGNSVPDKTHLNAQGSYVFGRIVAVDMGKAVPALAQYVKKEPAPLPAHGIRSMAILHGAPVGIVLVGDSTVAIGGGWGASFCALLTPNVECLDVAKNGRSSKSYYDEGLWKNALEQKPDYVLIQFGHNDMPGKGPERETDPETTYAANLRRYIKEAQAANARPVIVTSLSRRTYKDGKLVQDLTAYANAAKRVAAEENVPLIDLNAASVKLLQTMTQEQADRFDAEAHPDAAGNKGPDRTHLNATGAAVFARMVANDLAKLCVELGPDIKGELATKPQL